MKKNHLRRVFVAAAVGSLISLTGCGGDDDQSENVSAVVPIDLVTDKNSDNIPDELDLVVKNALAIVNAGTYGILDPEEEQPFYEAVRTIGQRLPFSAETIKALEEQNALKNKYETLTTEEELTDLMARMHDLDEELLKDKNYKIFNDALNKIPELNPPEGIEVADSTEATPQSNARQLKTSNATSGFEKLQRGDVMLVNSGGVGYLFPWAWHFTHAGTYDGNNQVYESVGGGVMTQSINEWKNKKRYAFGRNKNRTQSEVEAKLDEAKKRYGINGSTKYNMNFSNKNTDEKLYCSQLVWKIHKSLGDDIDSNSATWFLKISLKNSPIYFLSPPAALLANAVLIKTVLMPAVAPDEIYYATKVLNFYVDKK